MKMPELNHHEWWNILDILRDEGSASGSRLANKIQFDKESGCCRLCEEKAPPEDAHRCWYPEVAEQDGALIVMNVQQATGVHPDLSSPEKSWLGLSLSVRQRAQLVAAFNAIPKAT